ncbi:hypothetical protein V6N13_124875 [Hibiscus sabdariffa]
MSRCFLSARFLLAHFFVRFPALYKKAQDKSCCSCHAFANLKAVGLGPSYPVTISNGLWLVASLVVSCMRIETCLVASASPFV